MQFNLFKKPPLIRTAFFMAADTFFVALAVWLSFLLKFDADIPSQYFPFIFRMIALAVIFTIPIFYFNKLYSFSWSYVSASELISLFKAVTISFMFLGITIYISKYFPYFKNFPRSTIFVSYILVFIFSGGIRLSKRIYFRVTARSKIFGKSKALIVGAGDAGEQILRSILSSPDSIYFPVGFVDDNPSKKGVSIHGLRVLGKISQIPEVVKNHQIKQIIVALPSADNKTIRRAVELGRQAGVWKIKITPSLSEIIKGRVSFKNLKNVGAEDILGREPIFLDTKQIDNFIKGKIVLITGAAGSIGSELSRQTAAFNPKLLLLLDQDETGIFNISRELENSFPSLNIKAIVADVTDKEKINKIFKEFCLEIVFHAAAYKHVLMMEQNPDQAIKNNIFGTEVLSSAAIGFGSEKFIFVSTDKAVNPTSVMGNTKRIGEMICQSGNRQNRTKFISVRFGNVLDSRGSVIPIFREQIRRGGPVEVTDSEMERYFMLISEACLLVIQASAMGSGGEVFVLDMGKPIKILDLAKEMIKLSGFKPDKDIAIVFTGAKAGEKLFEEILTAEEGTVATRNQKIFMAKSPEIDYADLEKKLGEIKSVVNTGDEAKLKELLKSAVFPHK